jgi:hypothetical protein
MMIFELFRWWYGQGWRLAVIQSGRRLQVLMDEFSVATILRTLFAPWRRIITYPGAGLDAHLQAMLDNLVSRCIGFTVRIIVLFSVAVLAVILAVAGIVQIVTWPLLPLGIFLALAKGVM